MKIAGDHRSSKLSVCIDASRHFLLSAKDARAIAEKQQAAIETHWDDVCDEAKLSEVDKNLFWRRQFLNPFAFQD